MKAGSRLPKTYKKTTADFYIVQPDWVLLSDLESTLVIPPEIAILQLRPDILLYSTTTKTVIIVELTCSCEENMESWHATKFGKYGHLCSAIKTNRWSIHYFAVEVGA